MNLNQDDYDSDKKSSDEDGKTWCLLSVQALICVIIYAVAWTEYSMQSNLFLTIS